MSATPARHILMTADAIGGVWQYATDLAAAFAPLGHRVTLVVLGPAPSADQRQQAQRIPGLRLIESGLPLDWLSDGSQPVKRAAAALAQLAKGENVDIVHCNMPTLAGAAEWPVPLIAVTHGCVATWWEAARPGPLDATYLWHRRMMTDGLGAADAVVAPSAAYAAHVRSTYRLSSPPQVVHNGRAPPQLSEAAVDEPLAAALTVGRLWDPVKRAAMLDRVARRLPLPFLAAGEVIGPHGERIDLTHLQPLGQLDALPLSALLARRPVFVSAARFEPFGLAVLEAAQAGCALVLSDIPTFRELWDDAALFVAPEDEEGFVVATELLAANPAMRADLATRAKNRAARYTPQAQAVAMALLYDGLLTRQEVAA